MNTEKTEKIDIFEQINEGESTNIIETANILNNENIIENNNNSDVFDILENLEFADISASQENEKTNILDDLVFQEENEPEIVNISNNKFKSTIFFIIRYLSTCAFIFTILLVGLNFNAYFALAKSYISPEVLKNTQINLQKSTDTIKTEEKKEDKKELKVNIPIKVGKIELSKHKKFHSMSKLLTASSKEKIKLNIEITPYENRLVIPKIGKNIPLLDVKKKKVKNVKELEDVFMDELEHGIIRYPGSAKPGQKGNSFIFGHSSNFPWSKGEYNEVFALLDKVSFDDEVIVYYGQKKYVYKIREKRVIKPGEVSILKRNKGKSEITLMTCFPVGTTLNRLIVIGELQN